MEINTHGLIVEFGKHKGILWTRVPVGYLRWLINQNSRYADIAQAELDRRGSVLTDRLEISGHAIDRASLRIWKTWRSDRRKEEGLHAWLMRRGLEALDLAAGAERVKHAGVKWVFEHGELYATLLSVMPDGKAPEVEETEHD